MSTLKQWVASQVQAALVQCYQRLSVPSGTPQPSPHVERCRQPELGHYATNVAMVCAKSLKRSPQAIATELAAVLREQPGMVQVDVAGPGFVNMRLASDLLWDYIHQAAQGDALGAETVGAGQSVYVEFVSANPTGPLHVGHGRGAALGSSLAQILKRTGYRVHGEYYVNDAGRQMHILALSVWARQMADGDLPEGLYQGRYIADIAQSLVASLPALADSGSPKLYEQLMCMPEEGRDTAIDGCIEALKQHLGDRLYARLFEGALQYVLQGIQQDLKDFGADFDQWFSESSLYEGDALANKLEQWSEQGVAYQRDGAWWFKSTAFGDDKDRVLVRAHGEPTYFASDVLYHDHKARSGFDRMITIMGSDHHGYIPRLLGALRALGHATEPFHFPLVQFVSLFREGQPVPMSTRSGSFVTLKDLVSEVGLGAARYFYARTKSDQPMDFDLSLAVTQTHDNPIYYIQYAHARMCRVLEKSGGFSASEHFSIDDLAQHAAMERLVLHLQYYPDVLAQAAQDVAVHVLAQYLYDLARYFHAYYNDTPILVEDKAIRATHLTCLKAAQNVLADGLACLCIEPVTVM